MRLLRGGTISRLGAFPHTYFIAVVSPRGFLCPTAHTGGQSDLYLKFVDIGKQQALINGC